MGFLDRLRSNYITHKSIKSGQLSGIYAGYDKDQLIIYDKTNEQCKKGKGLADQIVRVERQLKNEGESASSKLEHIEIELLSTKLKKIFLKPNMFNFVHITPFELVEPTIDELTSKSGILLLTDYLTLKIKIDDLGFKIARQQLNINGNFSHKYGRFIRYVGQKMPLDSIFMEGIKKYLLS